MQIMPTKRRDKGNQEIFNIRDQIELIDKSAEVLVKNHSRLSAKRDYLMSQFWELSEPLIGPDLDNLQFRPKQSNKDKIVIKIKDKDSNEMSSLMSKLLGV